MKPNTKAPKLSLVHDVIVDSPSSKGKNSSLKEVFPKNPLIKENLDPDQILTYKEIGEELLEGRLDPECWAAAVQFSGNDEDRAKKVYLKWRKEKIEHSRHNNDEKEEALELRRLQSFVPMTDQQGFTNAATEFKEATFWVALIAIASIGGFLTIARFFEMNVYVFLSISFVLTLLIIQGIRSHCQHRLKERRSLGYTEITTIVAILMVVISLLITMASEKFEYWF